MVHSKKNRLTQGERMSREITIITDKNFTDYFDKHKTMINVKYDIKAWLDEKKKTLPDWHSYGFDEEGNIYYKFLLSGNPDWTIKYPLVKEAE